MGAKTDEVYRFEDRLRPRASVPYSLSAVLFLTGPIPFVNEEDFRSPLVTTGPALRHRTIRFGTVLDCNPPLIDSRQPGCFYCSLEYLLLYYHCQ